MLVQPAVRATLVYRWALQILTALSETFRNEIIHVDIVSLDCFWLFEDSSIALVAFQSADFVSLKGIVIKVMRNVERGLDIHGCRIYSTSDLLGRLTLLD